VAVSRPAGLSAPSHWHFPDRHRINPNLDAGGFIGAIADYDIVSGGPLNAKPGDICAPI
jgi:hypothetical protein